jgi:hypothetical protein
VPAFLIRGKFNICQYQNLCSIKPGSYRKRLPLISVIDSVKSAPQQPTKKTEKNMGKK